MRRMRWYCKSPWPETAWWRIRPVMSWIRAVIRWTCGILRRGRIMCWSSGSRATRLRPGPLIRGRRSLRRTLPFQGTPSSWRSALITAERAGLPWRSFPWNRTRFFMRTPILWSRSFYCCILPAGGISMAAGSGFRKGCLWTAVWFWAWRYLQPRRWCRPTSIMRMTSATIWPDWRALRTAYWTDRCLSIFCPRDWKITAIWTPCIPICFYI